MTITDVGRTETAPQSTRLLLTVIEAARRLSIGRTTLYELINDGEIETLHVGRSCRIPVDSLDALVARRRKGANTERRAGGPPNYRNRSGA